MTDRTLRWLVDAAIALLLVHQTGRVIDSLFGTLWGVLSALVVVAVSVLSARMARAGGRDSAWFLLPTLLFTVVPGAWLLWSALAREQGTLDVVVDIAPFVIGFAVPVVLLLVVHHALRKRDSLP